ncbi:hypothetical protein J2Z66_004895 [Paenibacillus eucommiae]|uniref:ATP-grasp domain-containing protein n=1 Tax=Paenibacillus eucommiae TaxID=1355755 RepID=A0ABS4J0A7_9BACL|nr:hypothetical protein [Paenibacillus eucommiae]
MIRTKIGISLQGSSIYLEERTIMLSESIVKKWKVPTNQLITLRFGSIKHEVKVIPFPHANSLRMTTTLAEKFGLYQDAQLCFQYKPSTGVMSIGPLLAVMLSRVYASPERPFGAATAFCKEITQACSTFGALVIFITPTDMRGSTTSVNGHVYTGKSWSKKSFPIPNVIYNRLTSRKYENMASVQQFMKEAKARNSTAIFNEKYLNKTEVFSALGKEETLHDYLPESHLFKNYKMLQSMASRHSCLFLKPITGSLGKGIIRIRKEAGGAYVSHSTHVNGVIKQTFPSLTKLFISLTGKLKSQRYQLQQGLDLITVDGGRPVDFRSLVQKGAQGEWTITSIVARIANSQHFVSNLARGGSLSKVKAALAKASLSAGQRASAYTKLRKASLDIAKGIEEQIPNHFGELGIDLAVDTHGKVWLLEVNSKPSKDDNSQLNAETKVRPSIKQVVQYARFLSKF